MLAALPGCEGRHVNTETRGRDLTLDTKSSASLQHLWHIKGRLCQSFLLHQMSVGALKFCRTAKKQRTLPASYYALAAYVALLRFLCMPAGGGSLC